MKGKKAQEVLGMNLWEFITIILAAIVIVAGALALTGVIKVYTSSEEQSTDASFFSLAVEMNKLIEINNTLDAKEAMTFYIANNFVVVAFDKGVSAGKDWCWNTDEYPTHTAYPEHTLLKPENYCGQSACLCLFPETDFVKAKPILCSKVNADYILGANAKLLEQKYRKTPYEFIYKDILGGAKITMPADYPLYPAGSQNAYTDLFIYGECDGWSSDVTFGTRPLYIEKQVINGNTYILVMGKSPETAARYKEMQKLAEAKQPASA